MTRFHAVRSIGIAPVLAGLFACKRALAFLLSESSKVEILSTGRVDTSSDAAASGTSLASVTVEARLNECKRCAKSELVKGLRSRAYVSFLIVGQEFDQPATRMRASPPQAVAIAVPSLGPGPSRRSGPFSACDLTQRIVRQEDSLRF